MTQFVPTPSPSKLPSLVSAAQLYDRRRDEVRLDEVERVVI
jgi:hypothetical protein